MKKLITILVLSLTGCEPKEAKHTQPPPDFTIVCDGKGHYAANWGNAVIVGGYDGDLTSRQAAIDRAWEQYIYHTNSLDMEERERKDRERWHDCDK